jgi:carbonic anhydrase/acetyltransferase-like protein (isoleucine patch superfamily)
MSYFKKTAGGYYLADNAMVVGDVTIGELVSFWFNAVVRGDVAPVTIGRGTNVQDCAVIHCDTDVPNHIGENVIIGHSAIVHGVSVGDGSLIGMSATVLGGSNIGKNCLIAAGALVPQGMEVPDGMTVMGVPGKIVRPVREEELKYMRWLANHYIELAQKHVDGAFKRARA